MMLRRTKSSLESGIREFVYLDETSVESLLAAVDGEILVQKSDTRTNEREATLSASAGLKSKVSGLSINPTLRTLSRNESQEVRKSVAQSAFARFRNRNLKSFKLRALPESTSPRQLARLARRLPKQLRASGRGVPIAELQRGDLIELDVELSATDSVKAKTSIDVMRRIFESIPNMVPHEAKQALELAGPLTRLIDELNGDSIPIIGLTSELLVEDIDREPWLVVDGTRSAPSSLAIYGVTQTDWYWGDVGAVLFGAHRYRVLCRVVDPTLREKAPGTYAGGVLGSVDTSLTETIDNFEAIMLQNMQSGFSGATAPVDRQLTTEALAMYATKLQLLQGVSISPVAAKDAVIGVEGTLENSPVSDQKRMFEEVDEALGVEESTLKDERAVLRDEIREFYHLWPGDHRLQQVEPEASAEARRFISVEVVAIYW